MHTSSSYVIIFVGYFSQATISIKISNLLICFCSFDLFCPILEKERKEGNVLFNDTLNTFYLRLYGIRHMVKDHSDSDKGNPLLPHGLLFPISSKGSFICTRIAHTMAFVTPVMDHWLEREIAPWVHPMKDQSDDPSHHERTLLPRSYISLPYT